MYIGVMHRTQIYLGDAETALLSRVAASTGASRSELIRRAVTAQYGGNIGQTRLAALHASAGTWKDRSATGASMSRTCEATSMNVSISWDYGEAARYLGRH